MEIAKIKMLCKLIYSSLKKWHLRQFFLKISMNFVLYERDQFQHHDLKCCKSPCINRNRRSSLKHSATANISCE